MPNKCLKRLAVNSRKLTRGNKEELGKWVKLHPSSCKVSKCVSPANALQDKTIYFNFFA